jgi:apolipoprotein N-acyltransferase
MKELICTALSAVMFYLSQGPANAWPLTWLAPVPLLWLAFGNTPAWRLLAVSFLAYLIGQVYIAQCYVGAPLLSLLSLLGLRPILFPLCILFARLLHRRLSLLPTLLAFPAGWTVMEFVAGLLSPHGSFGSVAYSEVSVPIVLQSASLFGMYSITFVLSLVASSLALAIRDRRVRLTAASVAAAICMVDLLFGATRLVAQQPEVVRVAAVGPLTQADGTDSLASDRQTSSVYASTLDALARRGARLIVTPEESLTTRRAWSAEALAPLTAVSQTTGAEIVAGVLQREPAGDIAVAFEPDGQTSVYAKRHRLMPFEAKFPPGTVPGLLGEGKAMAICKDMDFPDTIRNDAHAGLRLMMVPAWDSDIDAWIHARMAVLRGVENGFAVARAANHGLLSASDAYGRVIAQKVVGPDQIDWILSDLPLGPGLTLYTRIGNVFPWATLGLTLLLSVGLWAELKGLQRPLGGRPLRGLGQSGGWLS